MWLAVVLVIVILISILIVVRISPSYAERFLFNPSPTLHREREEFVWRSNEGRELGTRVVSGERDRAILFLYGNSASTANMMPVLERLSKYGDTYCVEYPGFGTLYGSPPSVRRCVESVHTSLSNLQNYESITIIAQSIGTLILSESLSELSIHVPNLKKISKVILITPFDDIAEVGAKMINAPSSLGQIVLPGLSSSNKWRNAYKDLHHLEITVIAATQDEITGFDQAIKLAEALQIYTTKVIKLNSSHNEALDLSVLETLVQTLP